MSFAHDDIIFAPATPRVPSPLAIIRISGAGAIALLAGAFSAPESLRDAPSHTLQYGAILDPRDGSVVDDVLVSVFRAPRSYTGEDTAEISCHGNPVIVERILGVLGSLGESEELRSRLAPGIRVRIAEPGEFTRRAFLHGRMDLARAEAVADIISAASERALTLARRQFAGEYSERVRAIREGLIETAALLEYALDFPEEGEPASVAGEAGRANKARGADATIGAHGTEGTSAADEAGRANKARGADATIGAHGTEGTSAADEASRAAAAIGVRGADATIGAHGTEGTSAEDNPEGIRPRLTGLIAQLSSMLAAYTSGKKIREGIRLVLAGPPNAGKSSLFNRLLREPRAIVSEIPGTTRDILHEDIQLDGQLFRLSDSAGLSETARDAIEEQGMARTREEIARADIVLFLAPDHQEEEAMRAYAELGRRSTNGTPILRVRTKSDLLPADARRETPENEIPISVVQEEGIGLLLSALKAEAARMTEHDAAGLCLGNERQRASLEAALRFLRSAESALSEGAEELASADIRRAARELDGIIGAVMSDEVLDAIFARFCVGK